MAGQEGGATITDRPPSHRPTGGARLAHAHGRGSGSRGSWKPVVEVVAAGDSGAKNVAGRVKLPAEQEKVNSPAGISPDGVARVGNVGANGPAVHDHDVMVDLLDEILSRSPMVIFSKSYCPHSKRAKVSDSIHLLIR